MAVRQALSPVVMLAEKPRIRDGEAPPRFRPESAIRKSVKEMGRGQWVMVPEAKARSMQRIARELNGSATWWKVSEQFCCFKVLDAPWAI